MIKRIGYQVGIILRDLVEMPNTVIDSIDETIGNFADAKMDAIIDYRKSVAMKNPVYAEIEERRKTNGDNIILFSEEDNLTREHFDIQQNIYDNATSEPLLMPFYRFLKHSPIKNILQKIKYANQRLNRGWDDTTTWSLDYHLTLTLGSQLKHLAETTHGWPATEGFPEFEDWQKALHMNGDALITYANKDDIIFADDEYDVKKEEQIIKDAQKALRWVAKYLPSLWD